MRNCPAAKAVVRQWLQPAYLLRRAETLQSVGVHHQGQVFQALLAQKDQRLPGGAFLPLPIGEKTEHAPRFAAQSLAVTDEWGIDYDDERLNVNGGAIALGHPLGCSGARLLTTMLHEMQRRDDATLGLATMCIGVGQGIAMVVERTA